MRTVQNSSKKSPIRLTETSARKAAATGRLRSLGDRANTGATQFLEIASELPHYSNRSSNDGTAGYGWQDLLCCGQKHSRCRLLFPGQLLRAYRSHRSVRISGQLLGG